jgi:hypothetical protein
MNTYLTKAEKLYALSKKELDKAKQLNDEELVRNACGKEWIATTDALRGFLLSQGLSEKQLPKSERQRQDLLAKYGDERMRLLYRSIRGAIHEDAYYEGMINYIFLFESMNDVKKFIYRCKNGG